VAHVKREEALALLKELGSVSLIQPSLVLIEQRKSDSYQLQIRGDYNRQLIGIFLKKRHFSLEMSNDYLIVFKA
jgi:hypothetical protein